MWESVVYTTLQNLLKRKPRAQTSIPALQKTGQLHQPNNAREGRERRKRSTPKQGRSTSTYRQRQPSSSGSARTCPHRWRSYCYSLPNGPWYRPPGRAALSVPAPGETCTTSSPLGCFALEAGLGLLVVLGGVLARRAAFARPFVWMGGGLGLRLDVVLEIAGLVWGGWYILRISMSAGDTYWVPEIHWIFVIVGRAGNTFSGSKRRSWEAPL